MFLKVQNQHDNWVIFDKITNLEFSNRPVTVKGPRELEVLESSVGPNNNRASHISPGSSYNYANELVSSQDSTEVAWAKFVQEGVQHVVLFTKPAYLCNENGDTVDKLSVGRIAGPKRGFYNDASMQSNPPEFLSRGRAR